MALNSFIRLCIISQKSLIYYNILLIYLTLHFCSHMPDWISSVVKNLIVIKAL